jgi:IclR family transcriptional regulator, pca regulon regulatory protein
MSRVSGRAKGQGSQPKSANGAMQKRPYFSESLARGLLVVQAFGRDDTKLKVSAIALKTGLPRATCRRFLLTLCDLGYAGCEGDTFYLKPKILDLGHSYLASGNVDTHIQRLLNELAARTQEASSYAVLDNHDVLVVARAVNRPWDFNVAAGTRFPPHLTSLGHVLLANLPPARLAEHLKIIFPKSSRDEIDKRKRFEKSLKTVQKQGYAFLKSPVTPHLNAIAVPILAGDKVVAALNLSSYNALKKQDAVKKYLPLLTETKLQIESALRR